MNIGQLTKYKTAYPKKWMCNKGRIVPYVHFNLTDNH